MNRVDRSGVPQQQGSPIEQNLGTPVANAINIPHVAVKHGERISNLTGSSLKPKIAPKRELKRTRSLPEIQIHKGKKKAIEGENNAPKKVRLRETNENNRELVNDHDLEVAESTIQEANELADTENNPGVPESKWESAKALLKGLWKSDLVRSIVFGAVAVLALAALTACVVAVPFSGGGSLIPLAIGIVALAVIFQGSFVAAIMGWGGDEPPPLAAHDKPPFQNAYQSVIDDAAKGDTPSYEKFMANPNVPGFLEDESQSKLLVPEFKKRLDALKKQNEEIQKHQDEIRKEQEKRAKVLANLQEQIKKANLEKQQGIERLQDEFDKLDPALVSLRQQLAQENAKDEVDIKEIRRLQIEIGRIEAVIARTEAGDALVKQKEALMQESQAAVQIYQNRIQNQPKTENHLRIETEIQSKKEALENDFKALVQKFNALEKIYSR